jgi:hypothetical protein
MTPTWREIIESMFPEWDEEKSGAERLAEFLVHEGVAPPQRLPGAGLLQDWCLPPGEQSDPLAAMPVDQHKEWRVIVKWEYRDEPDVYTSSGRIGEEVVRDRADYMRGRIDDTNDEWVRVEKRTVGEWEEA